MTLHLLLTLGAALGLGVAVATAATTWGERRQRPLLSTTGAAALVVALACLTALCLLNAWTVGR